jgi:uncharacterized protein
MAGRPTLTNGHPFELMSTPETILARPPAFHVMLKPRGPICNLDCRYCYYLAKRSLYPRSRFRLSEKILEEYTRQYIQAQQVQEATFAWQGGEPTLLGLGFFRRAVELQQLYRQPGMRIRNTLQTNGVNLDDEWCSFFREHDFLIGISLDGPAELHDVYRIDKGGRPTFDQVMAGVSLLKKHRVDFNILACVHAANADHPLEVYRFLRDEAEAQFIQFIPIVEPAEDTGLPKGQQASQPSVTGRQHGDFLIAIFDEWVKRDVGTVFVQLFDVGLAAWCGQQPGLCTFEETCGLALAMEHNGDLYVCDHYVEPRFKLGNIMQTPLAKLVASKRQVQFGQAKRDTLPSYCHSCDVRFVCNGGCPKNRVLKTPDGEMGLNYLCQGYKAFFTHIDRPMKLMASLLQAGQPPANIMHILAQEDEIRPFQYTQVGRNDQCPCGSGRKFKRCHGRKNSLGSAGDLI